VVLGETMKIIGQFNFRQSFETETYPTDTPWVIWQGNEATIFVPSPQAISEHARLQHGTETFIQLPVRKVILRTLYDVISREYPVTPETTVNTKTVYEKQHLSHTLTLPNSLFDAGR
jgi:hypothetical protein